MARALLDVGLWIFELREAGDAALDRLRFDDPLAALRWLRRASAAPGAGAILRRFFVERTGAADAAQREDDELFQQLAHLIASGRVVVVARPSVDLGTFGDSGDEMDEALPTSAVAPDSTREPAHAGRTWITIELIGEDDQPISGERYRVELPDGSVREGSLDQHGLARFFEIEPGSCVVTFPDLDQEAWESLGTTAEP